MENNCQEKILPVDDEKKIVDILEYNLRRKEYDVITAFDGEQALKQAKSGHPDLIVLDFMLPELSGLEVTAQLKNSGNTADFPIIFLSARNDTDSVVEGLSRGAADYITKPFNCTELFAIIEAQLELKCIVDQLKRTERDHRRAE